MTGIRTSYDPYANFPFRVTWNGRPVAGVSRVNGVDESKALTMLRGLTSDREFHRWCSDPSSRGALVIELRNERGELTPQFTFSVCRPSHYMAIDDGAENVAIETLIIERSA